MTHLGVLLVRYTSPDHMWGCDMHSNMDIRVHSCIAPLGATQYPLRGDPVVDMDEYVIPYSGPGSRPKDWPKCQCGKKADSCGSLTARQGRFWFWYSIDQSPSCNSCWMDIYETQGEED